MSWTKRRIDVPSRKAISASLLHTRKLSFLWLRRESMRIHHIYSVASSRKEDLQQQAHFQAYPLKTPHSDWQISAVLQMSPFLLPISCQTRKLVYQEMPMVAAHIACALQTWGQAEETSPRTSLRKVQAAFPLQTKSVLRAGCS